MASLLMRGNSPTSRRDERDIFDDGSDRYFNDFYHHLLRSSWPALLLQFAAAFVAANAIFALGYYLDKGVENARPGSFGDVFFFSIETMATIGYGKMAPST